MATTNFINGVTVSDAAWFNDINGHIYTSTPVSPATTVHPGSVIANTPAGGITSVTVQLALNELDTKKAPLTSAVLVTPNLGTPSAGVLTNCTGTAAGLTAGLATTVTTNANLTGDVTSVGNATTIKTSVTLVTPILGVATCTSLSPIAGTTTVAPIVLTSGTNLTSPVAGAEEFDGTAFYKTVDTTSGRAFKDIWQYFKLAANGSAISTIADVFGTNDGIPTVLNGIYEIEWHCYGTVATGGTATWTIVNTQTVTNMVADWLATPIAGLATAGASTSAGVITQTAASVALPVTGSLSVANHYHKIHAIIDAATAGNIRLRLTMSAGNWTPLRDSFFRVRRLPTANTGAFVA